MKYENCESIKNPNEHPKKVYELPEYFVGIGCYCMVFIQK